MNKSKQDNRLIGWPIKQTIDLLPEKLGKNRGKRLASVILAPTITQKLKACLKFRKR